MNATTNIELENVTRFMNTLEKEIARQNEVLAKFQAKFGNLNNVPSETMIDYESNLQRWDYLKSKRDAIKASIGHIAKISAQPKAA